MVISFLFFLFNYLLNLREGGRERERERESTSRGGAERVGERERIPSRLPAISTETWSSKSS